ncbi:hypothetical protein AB0I68_09635 [Streptomyces sp. NPDC050448]|uniref:hypothetical protein n=1 Tax=Streptomyces sp. NPDC050448 TaxID=3155404 RepID=UPI00341F30E4
MRRPARIPGVLAGLALALGGVVIAAPAAHADLVACQDLVQLQGTEVTDAVRIACYVGLTGDQDGCANGLPRPGVEGAIAAEACRQAPQ